MNAVNVPTIPQNDRASDKPDWLSALLFSPILWGGLLTVGFYSIIPLLPIQREFVTRYFCGHWILYSTTALFFTGIAILGSKAFGLPNQQAAFAFNFHRDPRLTAAADPSQKAMVLLGNLAELPPRIRKTWLADRYREIAHYLAVRQSSDSVEDHLKYLSDLEADRLHGSYAFVRTITWAVPILGFLGTVIGITMAIANITPDQLDTSMTEVTAGLAVAFDTTALSLSLSMILVFGSFVMEGAEEKILGRVDIIGMRDIAPLFPPQIAAKNPLEQAQSQAANQLLQRTETMVTWQTELWQSALETLRVRWSETVDQQQTQFATALKTGMGSSLGDHDEQLRSFRNEFLEGYRTISHDVSQLVAELQQASREQHAALSRQTSLVWEQVQKEVLELRESQAAQVERLTQGLSTEIQSWIAALQLASQGSSNQLEELRGQGAVLLRIVDQEENLARLQDRLTENLEAVRTADTFEETLHSLTAAVHLLTMRNRANAA